MTELWEQFLEGNLVLDFKEQTDQDIKIFCNTIVEAVLGHNLSHVAESIRTKLIYCMSIGARYYAYKDHTLIDGTNKRTKRMTVAEFLRGEKPLKPITEEEMETLYE